MRLHQPFYTESDSCVVIVKPSSLQPMQGLPLKAIVASIPFCSMLRHASASLICATCSANHVGSHGLQREALFYNACAEIGTGFLLVVMLASSARRAILLTFLYWNWLRMRYFSPDSATYHSQVGTARIMSTCSKHAEAYLCCII